MREVGVSIAKMLLLLLLLLRSAERGSVCSHTAHQPSQRSRSLSKHTQRHHTCQRSRVQKLSSSHWASQDWLFGHHHHSIAVPGEEVIYIAVTSQYASLQVCLLKPQLWLLYLKSRLIIFIDVFLFLIVLVMHACYSRHMTSDRFKSRNDRYDSVAVTTSGLVIFCWMTYTWCCWEFVVVIISFLSGFNQIVRHNVSH